MTAAETPQPADPLHVYTGANRELRDAIERVVFTSVIYAQSGQSYPGTLHSANEIMALVVAQHAAAQAAAEMRGREEAAKVARDACLVPPDGGSPTEADVAVCDAAVAGIRALPDAAWWRLVAWGSAGREPTREMMEAGARALITAGAAQCTQERAAEIVWRAMLAAAAQGPSDG